MEHQVIIEKNKLLDLHQITFCCASHGLSEKKLKKNTELQYTYFQILLEFFSIPVLNLMI